MAKHLPERLLVHALAAAAIAILACTENAPDQVYRESPTAAVKATSHATRLAQATAIDTTPTPRTEPTATPVPSLTPSPRQSTAFTVSKLTDDPHSDHMPAWSPDGSKIAFSSDSDSNRLREIHVINADGSNVIRLTDPDRSDDHFATWSPDGSKIAFDRGWEIYVMNADGSDVINITPDDNALNYQPAWSPVGPKIAFASDRDGDWDIYVMDADGSNIKRITENQADDDRPAWSPDGSKIAFQSDREGRQDIYVMDADGSNVQRVTRSSAVDQRPAWSPDGTKIAFQSNRDGNPAVFVIDADGSNVARITDSRPDKFGGPTWSPDGRFIAFEAVRNGDIYIVNVESLGVGPAQPFVPATTTTTNDRAALTTLYEATNGDEWYFNDGWLSDKPLDEWLGVTTDAQGRVTELRLTDHGLTGSIPPVIGQLTELTYLDLGWNQLTGSIPPVIGQLTELTGLGLFRNRLTGSIPPEIGQLTELTWLGLDQNQLTGSIPTVIGQLTELTGLGLTGNQLTGSIPTEIGQLTELTWLNIHGNQLTGSIPTEIGQLTELTRLDLDDNQLTGSIPPEIGQLTELTWLYLDDNQLTGSIPPEIGQLTELTGLGLTGNQLTGSIPPEIGQLTELTGLGLTGNQLTGCIPDALRLVLVGHNDLYEIDLPGCGADAPAADDRAVLTAFYRATGGDGWTDADVKADWLSDKPVGEWIGVRAEDGRVTGLSLAGLGLRGEVPASIGELSELSHLDLSSNSLTGDLPDSLGDLRSIQVLLIAGNGLSGCVPESLRGTQVSDVVFTSLYYCDDDDYDAVNRNTKPVPEWPGSVEWHVGDSVREPEERAARLGVQWLHEYAQENSWPMTGEGLTTHIETRDRLDRLISACKNRFWRVPLVTWKCDDLRDVKIGGLAMSWPQLSIEANFVKATEPETPLSLIHLNHMANNAAHEGFHTSFQHQVRGFNSDPSPLWILEGMATYFAAVVVDTHSTATQPGGPGFFLEEREAWVEKAMDAAIHQSDCVYHCGPLAVELLVSLVGVEQTAQFYVAVRRTSLELFTESVLQELGWPGDPDAWHEPFQETFGITVPAFYEMYREHKANGFQFDNPDDVPYRP